MINALIFRLPSKPSSESVKLEVQHMRIFIEIDYTTISTLHKLIDKWLTQSVQNSCNLCVDSVVNIHLMNVMVFTICSILLR